MIGTTTSTRERRRQETLARILDAAWRLAEEEGLAGISLRELARRVGMQQPSLYTYFPSKAGLYDAMFAEGSADLLARIRADDPPAAPRPWLEHSIRFFLQWAMERPARYQLLFQRTVPGFEPSPASYAVALEVEQEFVQALADHGFGGPTANRIWGLVLVGLTDLQLANDPGGAPWTDVIEDLAGMFAAQQRRRPAR